MSSFTASPADTKPTTRNAAQGLRLSGMLALTLLIGACAGTPNPQLAAAGGNQECRYLEVTGTNIPKRFCRTTAEWENIDAAERAASDEYSRQSSEGSSIMQDSNNTSPF